MYIFELVFMLATWWLIKYLEVCIFVQPTELRPYGTTVLTSSSVTRLDRRFGIAKYELCYSRARV